LNATRTEIPRPRAGRVLFARVAPTARATIPDKGLSKNRVSIWRQVFYPTFASKPIHVSVPLAGGLRGFSGFLSGI
jgi:hypothetical protein